MNTRLTVSDASNLLKHPVIHYFWTKKKDGWTLVTKDGREMRRTSYCRGRRKIEAMVEIARIFSAEVYRDQVFIDLRHVKQMGHVWSVGGLTGVLTAISEATPV